jgi:hypothetical protein
LPDTIVVLPVGAGAEAGVEGWALAPEAVGEGVAVPAEGAAEVPGAVVAGADEVPAPGVGVPVG